MFEVAERGCVLKASIGPSAIALLLTAVWIFALIWNSWGRVSRVIGAGRPLWPELAPTLLMAGAGILIPSIGLALARNERGKIEGIIRSALATNTTGHAT